LEQARELLVSEPLALLLRLGWRLQLKERVGCPLPAAPAAALAGGPVTITVPGPGTWTLQVWLTNAAGNSSAANVARATLVVPTGEPRGGGSTGTNASRGSSGDGGGRSHSLKPALRVLEALHGHELAVRIIGPSSGTVYVSYSGRYHGKLIATAIKKARLRDGELRLTFTLSGFVAAHATIRVSARLDHHAAAIGTLRRR
jgi:hypothetical protein